MNSLVNPLPKLHLNGQRNTLIEENLVQSSINLPIAGMSHMELQLSNWGVPPGKNEAGFLFSDINPGDSISVIMGLSEQTTLFEGEITAIEEIYGEGAPQIVFLAEDKLHQLARMRYSNAYEDMSIDDVINNICAQLSLPSDINVSSEIVSFNQINESHLACLLRIGQGYNIHPRIDNNTFIMRPEENDTAPIELHIQRDIENIRLIADLNHQPSTTRSYGWNLNNNEAVDADATTRTSGQHAASLLNDLNWANDDISPFPFPMTQNQAENYSHAQQDKQANNFVHARMSCIGDTRLKSGKQIKLAGGSPRFNGTYRVINCQHQFDRSNGYQSHLLLQKPAIGES